MYQIEILKYPVKMLSTVSTYQSLQTNSKASTKNQNSVKMATKLSSFVEKIYQPPWACTTPPTITAISLLFVMCYALIE